MEDLAKKIAQLPEDLQKIIADFIDLLINKENSQDPNENISDFWFPEIKKLDLNSKKIPPSSLLENFSGMLSDEYDQIAESGKSLKEFILENWECIS